MPLLFLNQALLWALAAAGIPVILHLLHRRRARTDFLPTLGFLRQGYAANRSRLRVKNLLILFLRVLAVALLVLTLARPAWMGEFFSRKGTAPVSAVIVLDNSVSMAYSEAGRQRFDRARELAREAIRRLPPGSRAALVATGLGPRGESLDADFTFRTDTIAEAAGRLDISAYGGDCVRATRRAFAMLEESRDDGPDAAGEVYVVSDLAAHAWQGLAGLQPPSAVSVIVLDVGADKNENFSVDTASAEWRTVPAPHVAVTSAISSGTLSADRLVEVNIAGVKRAERLVKMGAGARQNQAFEVPTLDPGSGPVQGWIVLHDPDPVRADNTRYFTVPRSRGLDVLIVRSGEERPADAAFFLGNALAPAGLAGAAGIAVRYADAAKIDARTLDGADVAVLADAAEVPAEAFAALERFAVMGKGLIVFLGDDADAGGYERFLTTYFGVSLGPSQSADAARPRRLEVFSFDHPMLAAFAGGRNGNLAATRLYRWRALAQAAGAGAAPGQLARIEGAGPAILSAPVGAGRAVVAAFAPVREATDLPLRAPFVPLAHEMVRYASGVRGQMGPSAVGCDVGAPVRFPVERSGEAARAEVLTPLDRKPSRVALAPGAADFVYRAFFPGNYAVRLPGKNGPTEAAFSVNLPASESAPDRLTHEAVARDLAGAVVARDLSGRPLRKVWGRTRGARELFDLFLAAAVAVLALEEYLANRFYREADTARAAGGGR